MENKDAKNKLRKPEQRQNHGYREHFDGCQMRCEEMSEEMRGLISTNRGREKARNWKSI